MSSKQQANQLVTGFVFLVLIAAGIYVVNSNVASQQGGAPTETVPEGIGGGPTIIPTDSDEPVMQSNTVPALLVSTNGDATNLYRRMGDEDTLLFTDSDETSKVQQFLGTNGSDTAFAWTSSDQLGAAGTVSKISLDGSGTLTPLTDEIVASAAPAISQNGSTIAYVRFDNSEGNFGFSIVTQATSGGGIKTIDSHEQGIALPAWNEAGTLVYVAGQATPDSGQEVRIKGTTVFASDANQVVSDVAWLGTNRLAVVVEPLGNNAQNNAKTLVINATTGDIAETVDVTGKDRHVSGSSDGNFLAIIAGTVSGLDQPSGTVVIVDLATGERSELGAAATTVGFLQ